LRERPRIVTVTEAGEWGVVRIDHIELATWSAASPPRIPMKRTLATVLLLAVGRTATAQLYFAGPNPGQNVPRQVYQPGQVAVSTTPGLVPTPVYANPPAQGLTVVGGQPLGTYQPGQVAITGVQPGGYTSGGTMTNTSSYNGSASSDGSAAQSFSSAFAPSGLGDAAGAGVDAAFGLTGNQTSYRQPYGQRPTYGGQFYNVQQPRQPTYGSQFYNAQRPQQPTYSSQYYNAQRPQQPTYSSQYYNVQQPQQPNRNQPYFQPRLYSSFQHQR